MANDDKKPVVPTKTAVKRVESDKKPNIFKRAIKWLKDMRSELKKVIWPTPQQTINFTGISLVFMGISAVVIWGFDEVASMAIRALITVVG